MFRAPDSVLAFREHFPSLRTKVHLANNSMGAVSEAFIAAHRQYVEERQEHGATWHLAMRQHESLRESFAALIGAKPNEIAVCYAATQALGVVASCLEWCDRPGVVFDDYIFPSVAYLWHAQERLGAKVRRVQPDDEGNILPQHFAAVLDESVQLVSVAHVSYKNGHRLDIAEVARQAHAVGAMMVVDDYQCCGSRRMNVREVGIDILVAGTVKFLLGSPGVALLYVREELLERLHPTITGWFGQADPNDFQIARHVPANDASRFQIGTPAFSAIYDSLAGIELVQSVGLQKIEEWIERLTGHLIERLDAHGFVSATPTDPRRRGPQVSIRSCDAERVVEELARRGIACSSRDGNIRTAWHYYNTPEDVTALIAALEDLRPMMATKQGG